MNKAKNTIKKDCKTTDTINIQSGKRPQWTYRIPTNSIKEYPNSQNMLIRKKVDDIKNNKYLYAIYGAMKQIGKQHGAVIVQVIENHPYKININERNYIIFLSYILGTIQGRLKNKIIGRHDFINGEIFKKIESTDKSDIKEAHEKYVNIKTTKK